MKRTLQTFWIFNLQRRFPLQLPNKPTSAATSRLKCNHLITSY